jgi:DNA-binding CsgD family transcriptional regulator
MITPNSTGYPLTPQQRRVAVLIGSGATRAETARLLNLSQSRIGQHIQAAASKIGGRGTPATRLARWAAQHAPVGIEPESTLGELLVALSS